MWGTRIRHQLQANCLSTLSFDVNYQNDSLNFASSAEESACGAVSLLALFFGVSQSFNELLATTEFNQEAPDVEVPAPPCKAGIRQPRP